MEKLRGSLASAAASELPPRTLSRTSPRIGAGAGTARVVDDKAQSAVEILPCRQHDGEFAGNLAEGRFVNTAGTAELDLQQLAETSAAIGWIGAQHDLPLALQPLDYDGAIGRLHDAANDIAAAIDRRPAKRRHVSFSNRGLIWFAAEVKENPSQRFKRRSPAGQRRLLAPGLCSSLPASGRKIELARENVPDNADKPCISSP